MKRTVSKRLIYLCSVGLPALALTVYLTLGPIPNLKAELDDCYCYIAGNQYSLGYNDPDSCAAGQVKTCSEDKGGNCYWSNCQAPP